MKRARPLTATLLAAATLTPALVLGGCGGSDETSTATEPTATAPATTSSTTTVPTTTATTSTTTPTTTTQPTTTTGEPDPSKPDSERNDTMGDPNTPEGAFDEACQRNPESCG